MKNRKKINYGKKTKLTALLLLGIMTCQLVYPTAAIALTSGPTQPEVQGFEPVGTTDMVDMFSGSFVYNIPLIDVEGYPINISYHGGSSMEQEASWVGLGWNINPGVINRTVRGVPDDFDGDSLRKDFHIKPEKTLRVGMGGGAEVVGAGDPLLKLNASLGANVNVSNYRGVSCDFTYGGGINVFHSVSAGVNMGVGSQTGASVDYNASLAISSSQILGKDHAGGGSINAGVGGGYNTRSGLKSLSFSCGASANYDATKKNSTKGTSMEGGINIPIGVQNYVAVITNSSTMNSIYGRIKAGGEALGGYAYGNISAMFSKLTFENDASRLSYGYMYLQNAGINGKDILDFTRDKDGMFNKSMQYLPVPNMTYDIYSLSGQGTGGIFRPFRNDFGSIYDPLTTSATENKTGQIEAGLGNVFESGMDYTQSNTNISSGPWSSYQRSGGAKGYTQRRNGSIYENMYFKAGGELTMVDSQYYTAIGEDKAITPDAVMALPGKKPGSDAQRDPRGNLIYYHTAAEAKLPGVGTDSLILNYTDHSFVSYGDPTTQTINRVGFGDYQRKKHQLSEIVQVQKDGRKYVYGIPAMNNVQREVTLSVDPSTALPDGRIIFSPGDATNTNNKGKDNYYSSSVTPSYAHSFLLTSVLSNDYVDVTGNGVTDDDLGSYTKFDYTRDDSDYRWIAPYSTGVVGQHNPGFLSDKTDDKANFVCGSREQWTLHAVETKNYIAEFYTSPRSDARGISNKILNEGAPNVFTNDKWGFSLSYKLDSIKLYNKHDRFVNRDNAVPIKTVFFVYDYSLCSGVPNSVSGGKLTLQKIYFRYGNSQKSMISPYQFTYSPIDPDYNLAEKDRWGNYKPSNPVFPNHEFPYVNQNDASLNSYASAWSLIKISLPSGGVIEANYECNDYAYVQDKTANEMFMVKGVGTSPNFSGSYQLYIDKNNPNLFMYFSRRHGSEKSSLNFVENYLGKDFQISGDNCLYFNFNVQLTNSASTYEQIKGYARVTGAGICSNNSDYGYIKFQSSEPKGGGGILNPITYTALNTARYNLPHIVFPGQDPNESNLKNVLAGMKGAFKELLNMGKSPVLNLVTQGGGRNVNLNKSYIRLQCVGLNKKGGGQRVRSLYFRDRWDILAGGNEHGEFYGKEYSYKTNSPDFGDISSGVASYEPLIGGDENPFRQPVKYITQSGSNWPPNDAVDLYQEMPIGESLFPSGQIGYSSVKVSSVHKNTARSAKSLDIYEFYTAKDFPLQSIATAINTSTTNKYSFFTQENFITARQGYTMIFNDMHGKPKKVEHGVYDNASGQYKPLNYQVFNYKQKGNKLDNRVKCFVKIGSDIVVTTKQLGMEEDITLDSREKKEHTKNKTRNGNLNAFIIPLIVPVPVAIPFAFGWNNSSETKFQSAAVTKVIQQYGILDNVESYNEGAKTTIYNEIYDAITGVPIVTSVNNEFNDKEYTTNVPAWWVYKGMSGAYENIGYTDVGSISVGANNIGTLNITNTSPLMPGDQISISYSISGIHYHTIAWVMGKIPVYSGGGDATCDGINVLPRFPSNTSGWNSGTTLSNVAIRVISSGHKNMLIENAESYTSTSYPTTATGVLSSNLRNLIDLNAKTYADSTTRIANKYFAHANDINPYASGERGQWRLLSEYKYHTNRKYGSATSRTSGLYTASSLFSPSTGLPIPMCSTSPYNYLVPVFSDSNWHPMRTITKWSPFGKEVENMDAIGNYSTAEYGYNEELAVSVTANAKQGEVLSLGFEDNNLLKEIEDTLYFRYFTYHSVGVGPLSTPSSRYQMTLPTPNISDAAAHTGLYSYKTENDYAYIPIPINRNNYTGIVRKYNNYFSTSPTTGYHYTSANEYLGFGVCPKTDYILNFWVKVGFTTSNSIAFRYLGNFAVEVFSGGSMTSYSAEIKTNLIDGWQQMEVKFPVPESADSIRTNFAKDYYIDDLRIFPVKANMKAFVYGPVSTSLPTARQKLMATLDENNFATLYEYDHEGNLVRVKKETTKGIMTVSESRSGNPKK